MRILGATDADALIGNDWFEGYAENIEVHDELVTLEHFDAEARGHAEYVVFANGLTVTGTLDLKSGVQSIFFVKGDLHVGRLVLGDAVLVVSGKVVAREWVFGPFGEGLFDVAGAQVEGDVDALMAGIEANTVALFNRRTREFELRPARPLLPELVDDGDVRADALRKRLEAGQSIF